MSGPRGEVRAIVIAIRKGAAQLLATRAPQNITRAQHTLLPLPILPPKLFHLAPPPRQAHTPNSDVQDWVINVLPAPDLTGGGDVRLGEPVRDGRQLHSSPQVIRAGGYSFLQSRCLVLTPSLGCRTLLRTLIRSSSAFSHNPLEILRPSLGRRVVSTADLMMATIYEPSPGFLEANPNWAPV